MRIIARGAESVIYLERWLGRTVVVKERVRKRYRVPEVDDRIRVHRTINEVRNMMRARALGINVPRVYDVDLSRCIIRMEYIDGVTLLDLISARGCSEDVLKHLNTLGTYVGILHGDGIIHGDPTLTNVIVRGESAYMIDFGLSERVGDSKSDPRFLERCSVDIDVAFRCIEANFSNVETVLKREFILGYERVVGKDFCSRVLKHVDRIRRLARYVMRADHQMIFLDLQG